MSQAQDFSIYIGTYDMPGMPGLRVVEHEGGIAMTMPNMPPGFVFKMTPESEHKFRLHGGPVDGMLTEFTLDDDGNVIGSTAGPYVLTRVEASTAPTRSAYYPAPKLDLTDEKVAAFDALYASLSERDSNVPIPYDLPYPKHEFLRYLGLHKPVILHGSNKGDIDVFAPVRKSTELYDSEERGNLAAIYGTHRGIWPMFFALLDREKMTGSMRNGPMEMDGPDGSKQLFYQFSIGEHLKDINPWRTGTVYILPRATFTRLKNQEGGYFDEWASKTAVNPLAKLVVEPEDFPMLDQVAYHDDSELLESGRLGKIVYGAVTDIEPYEGGLTMKLDWREDVAAAFIEYLPYIRKFQPAVRLELIFEPKNGPVWLRQDGPGAVIQTLTNDLKKQIAKETE